MKDFSFLTNSHPSYVEELYHDFNNDPTSIDPELKKFFEGFDFAIFNTKKNENRGVTTTPNIAEEATATSPWQDIQKEFGVYQLIRAYRKEGI